MRTWVDMDRSLSMMTPRSRTCFEGVIHAPAIWSGPIRQCPSRLAEPSHIISVFDGLSLRRLPDSECFTFTIGHANPSYISSLFSFTVTHCNSIKDLGITLEPSLKFKSHIMDIIARATCSPDTSLFCIAFNQEHDTCLINLHQPHARVCHYSMVPLSNYPHKRHRTRSKTIYEKISWPQKLSFQRALKTSWPTKPRTSPTKIWPHFMLQYHSQPIRHPTWQNVHPQ